MNKHINSYNNFIKKQSVENVPKPKGIKNATMLHQWLIDNGFDVKFGTYNDSGKTCYDIYSVRGFNVNLDVDVIDEKTVIMTLPDGRYRTKGVQSAANWFWEFLN